MLEDLRDIHIPEPVSWWPPAPGWWLIFAVLISIPVIIRWWRQRQARKMAAADTIAFVTLESLRAEFSADQDIKKLLLGLSALLRRVAMTISSRQEVASLTGEAWLAWLDQQTDEILFSEGPGQLIADIQYRPQTSNTDTDGEDILRICERWIIAVFRQE